MTIELVNVRLLDQNDLQRVHVDDTGVIAAIAPMNASRDAGIGPRLSKTRFDLAGDWLTLGGVDLQINGGLGLAFPDVTESDRPTLTKICDYLWQQGVDGCLPTIVTTSIAKIQQSLGILSQFMAAQPPSASTTKILGVHLEGPFLRPEKRGAHPAEHLLPLTLENVKRVLGDYAPIIKLITLAPELDSRQTIIPYLRSQGILVSLGHSLATAEQAQTAFELGASLVTHAFNAMPSLHHRQPGLLGAAIAHPQVCCGLIADGQHVAPIMMQLLLRASKFEQGIFLVSDALAPMGLPDGRYPWDQRQIEVNKGTARLSDGTLAGTTLPLLVGAQNLAQWQLCSAQQAIALATVAPREAITLPRLQVGSMAHVLRWHWQETTQQLSWERLSDHPHP